MKMSIPTLQCIKRSYTEPLSFSDWVHMEENIYISTNLKKYLNNPDSKDEWGHAFLDYKLYSNQITREEFLTEYEKFIRNHRWEDLELLSGKNLGCWCEKSSECHGKVLQKLFKERLLEKRMTERDTMPLHLDSDNSN